MSVKRNQEAQPLREEAWADVSDPERIERLRSIVKFLRMEHDRMTDEVRRLTAMMFAHVHCERDVVKVAVTKDDLNAFTIGWSRVSCEPSDFI